MPQTPQVDVQGTPIAVHDEDAPDSPNVAQDDDDLDQLNEQLSAAAADGDVDSIRLHLAKAPSSINVRNAQGMTPLYRAVLWNREDAVKVLLEEYAPDVEIRDDDGETPLWRAVYESNFVNTEILISHRANVNAKDDDGRSILVAAITSFQEPKASIVSLLLEKGANITTLAANGDNVLHIAAAQPYQEILKILLDYPVPSDLILAKDKDGQTPLLRAAIGNQKDNVDLLLEHGAKLGATDNEGDTEICQAAFHGNKDLAELLLQNGADIQTVNRYGRTPLHWSAESGSVPVMELLIERGADSTAKDNAGWTALHIAAYLGNTEVVEFLIKKWSTRYASLIRAKNVHNYSALHLAADEDNLAEVQLLLNANADVVPRRTRDGQDWEQMEIMELRLVDKIGNMLLPSDNIGDTLSSDQVKSLNWAARNGHKNLVELLLSHTTRQHVREVLYWAAVGGQEEILDVALKALEKFGDDLSEGGIDAVQAAAQNGHMGIVQKLLQILRSNKSPMETNNWTPLQWVIAHEGKEAVNMVRNILKNRADPDSENGDMENALSAVEMARVLRSRSSGEREEHYAKIVALLETPLTLPPKQLPPVRPELASKELEEACEQYSANVIDFYPWNGLFYTVERKTVVKEIIYSPIGGPNKTMKRARETWEIDPDLEHQLRWVHLSANNWTWVNDLMRRVSYDSKMSSAEYTRLMDFLNESRREHSGEVHARYMYPSLSFEKQDIHYGERADFMKLKHRNKGSEKKGEQDKATKQENLLVPAKTDENKSKTGDSEDRPESGIKERSKKEKLKGSKDMRPKDSEEFQGHTGQGNVEDKKSDETEAAHLKGGKLALFIPYLTLQTVANHQKQRQAILLTEPAPDMSSGSSSEDKRLKILMRSIQKGCTILGDLVKKCGKLKLEDDLTEELRKWHDLCQSVESTQDDGTWVKNHMQQLKSYMEKSSVREIEKNFLDTDILMWQENLKDAIELYEMKDKHLKLEKLFQYYLKPSQGNGIHVIRTLDQYYYSSLADTSRRDNDQVVRRYQKHMSENEKHSDNNDSDEYMGMVDQLWLWVIDDKTIITCFPHSWSQEPKSNQQRELLDSVREWVRKETQLKSVYDLAVLITGICVDFVDDCKVPFRGGGESLLHMFASEISRAAEKEVKYFDTFKREFKIQPNNAPGDQLDLEKEIDLLEEVKDIMDELNIIMSISEEQNHWLQKLFNLITKGDSVKGDSMKEPLRNDYQDWTDLPLRVEKIKKMQGDAKRIYDSLNHLLDLKQKNANLFEASQARRQTEQTTKHNRQMTEQNTQMAKQSVVILWFTIVTIIFLPMSFLVSIFNLNIRSFPHEGDTLSYPPSWVFARIFGSSAAITVPLILVAFKMYNQKNVKHTSDTDPTAEGNKVRHEKSTTRSRHPKKVDWRREWKRFWPHFRKRGADTDSASKMEQGERQNGKTGHEGVGSESDENKVEN